MTHNQLVRRMANWLKATKGYTVVISELSTRLGETPDVIAWKYEALSTLIECKVSRADFLADKKKCFRRAEDTGMGDWRYFAAPKGLLSAADIPEGWGLLEVGERRIRETVKPEPKEANKRAECVMLMSTLRRLEISTAVYVVAENPSVQEGVDMTDIGEPYIGAWTKIPENRRMPASGIYSQRHFTGGYEAILRADIKNVTQFFGRHCTHYYYHGPIPEALQFVEAIEREPTDA